MPRVNGLRASGSGLRAWFRTSTPYVGAGFSRPRQADLKVGLYERPSA